MNGKTSKFKVRFHFWQNPHNRIIREVEAITGYVLSWEEREFEEIEEAMRFAKRIESQWVKVFDKGGRIIHDSHLNNLHNFY
jgi:hypothetical protein